VATRKRSLSCPDGHDSDAADTAFSCETSNCQNRSLSGSDYCAYHKCALTSKCPNERTSYSEFCHFQRCTYPVSQGVNCPARKYFKSQDGRSATMYNFCLAHKCTDLDCKRARMNHHPFCVHHCCIKPGCTGKRCAEAHLCEEDKCEYDECPCMKLPEKRNCGRH
jgi:hypothetical protein